MGEDDQGIAAGRRLTADLFWEAGGEGWIEVIGASMEPLLPLGAEVRLRRVEGRLHPGSLVLFPYREELAVHRVIGRSGSGLRTKGDRSLRSDPGLRGGGELFGVVVRARHSGREAALESGAWRTAGVLVAIHSRLCDLLASPLPRPLLESGGGLAGRALRKLLRMGNSSVPRLVSWVLRPTWREPGPGA